MLTGTFYDNFLFIKIFQILRPKFGVPFIKMWIGKKRHLKHDLIQSNISKGTSMFPIIKSNVEYYLLSVFIEKVLNIWFNTQLYNNIMY